MLVASIVIFWPSQDDLSRYGYIYLMKHKSETFEKFKEFQSEVENHHNKKIKFLWFDHRDKYLSYEFGLQLKQCGIVSQLTPPGTPQRYGVSEHRNCTLLDMVRSMMSLIDLPLLFWGYALETAAFTLKRAPFHYKKNTLSWLYVFVTVGRFFCHACTSMTILWHNQDSHTCAVVEVFHDITKIIITEVSTSMMIKRAS